MAYKEFYLQVIFLLIHYRKKESFDNMGFTNVKSTDKAHINVNHMIECCCFFVLSRVESLAFDQSMLIRNFNEYYEIWNFILLLDKSKMS